MKVLHLSDASCADFGSLYAACDVLVTTGDLDLMPIVLGRLGVPKPAFAVYGNHCIPGYMDRFGLVNLHDRVVRWAGLSWGGFQGSLRYKDLSTLFVESEAQAWAARFPRVDVLLLHAPPLGLLDDQRDAMHRGSAGVRDYVLERKPRVVFCGHVHDNAELALPGVLVHRTYGGRLVELDLPVTDGQQEDDPMPWRT